MVAFLILLVLAGCGLIGLTCGRWAFAVIAVAFGTLGLFLTINDGLYGHGWGESGHSFVAIWGLLALAGTGVGVALRDHRGLH